MRIKQPDWQVVARLNAPGEADAEQWQPWSPREEIAPSLSHAEAGVLQISGTEDGTSYGSWRRTVGSFASLRIRPGAAYRLTARCRCEGVERITQSVFARLHWLDDKGKPVRHLDNAIVREMGDGRWEIGDGEEAKSDPRSPISDLPSPNVDYTALAPEGATRLVVELGLRWSAGTVRWGEVNLYEAPHLPSRRVKLATVFHRPRNTRSAADSVSAFRDVVESHAPSDCDLICLPEGMTLIGTGKSYFDVAEPLPGPTTETLGALARRRGCYIVAGLFEREGHCIYNTAVLIDRKGQLVGTYRKTHLPQEESDAGLTPGGVRNDEIRMTNDETNPNAQISNDQTGEATSFRHSSFVLRHSRRSEAFPVFETDFGRIGIIICWDVQFPEPARAVAAAGAEIILLPIWGGSEVVTRARAIENHVFLVSSSYDMRTMIVDPTGKVLVEASAEQPVVSAEVDLDRPIYQPWLGDMRWRTWTERQDL